MIRPRFVIAALAFVGMAAPGVAQVASLPASGPVIQRVGKDVRLDAPAKPRHPNGAYRSASFNLASVNPENSSYLLPSPVPGMIRFGVDTEVWTGERYMLPVGYDVSQVRVEVYDPKDPGCETPIFIKNGPARPTRAGDAMPFFERGGEEINIGPFPASDRPYVVMLKMLNGKAKADEKAERNQFTRATTKKVLVN